jgi:hypothetical protein
MKNSVPASSLRLHPSSLRRAARTALTLGAVLITTEEWQYLLEQYRWSQRNLCLVLAAQIALCTVPNAERKTTMT